jgi:2-iminobutanoate/2-iminopropanoate deaminase
MLSSYGDQHSTEMRHEKGDLSAMAQREQISTAQAPAAIGPYSQAIRTDSFIFASGQVALDPASGQLTGEDVRAQTCQAMENVKAVLEAAGTSLANVVKTTVFLTSMANFSAMNEVYGQYFGEAPPARSTVAVAELPRGALVEIEVLALRG